MFQAPLLDLQQKKTVSYNNLRLSYDKYDGCYMWLLELNSNKFYIRFDIDNDNNLIIEFEICSVKWYFERDLKIIKTIRKIVQNLYTIAIN